MERLDQTESPRGRDPRQLTGQTRAAEAAGSPQLERADDRPPTTWLWRFGTGIATAVLLAITIGGVWQIHRVATLVAITPARAASPTPVASARAAAILFLPADTFRGAVAVAPFPAPPADTPVELQVQVHGDPGIRWSLLLIQNGRILFRANGLSIQHRGPIGYLSAHVAPETLVTGAFRVILTPSDSGPVVTHDFSVRPSC